MATKLLLRKILARGHSECSPWRLFSCITQFPSRNVLGHSEPSFASSLDQREHLLPFSSRLGLADSSKDGMDGHKYTYFQTKVLSVHPLVQNALKGNSRSEQDSMDLVGTLKEFEAVFQRLGSEQEDSIDQKKSKIFPMQNKQFCILGSRLKSGGGSYTPPKQQAFAAGGSILLQGRGHCIRHMSTGSAVAESLHEEADSLQAGLLGISDSVTEVVAAASSSSPGLVNEVAIAAADSSFPCAVLQYLIEAVHLQAGLPWWGSIAIATIFVRMFTFPIIVYQMRATARLSLLRPEMELISNAIKDSGYDPKVAAENQKRLKDLFKRHNTSPFTPLVGGFIQAPIFICFFFAISNMAEKVPSFKEGGSLWFIDLSTPDDMYIMPVLTALIFWITVELGAADGMQGQPNLEKMKMFLRALAVIMIPMTASFPKALFCYWMTSNLFSLVQSTVLKQEMVKKFFGIPNVSHLASKPKSSPEQVATFINPPKRIKRLSVDRGSEEK